MNRQSGMLVCLLAAALLVGCGPTTSPQDLLAQARQFRSKGDFKSALIQARNAVQLSPELAEAHYLKGAIYLDLGEARLAEEELRRAIALKMDAQAVIPVLARSLLKQGKYQDILDETVPGRFPVTVHSADVASLRGDAYLGLKRIRSAQETYEKALQYQADFPEALIGLAKITAANRHPEEAVQLVERALVKSPSNFDALLLKGDLQRVLGNPQAALSAYEKAVRQKPNDLNARLTLAALQIGLDKINDAPANIAVVLKVAPESPTANYLLALIEFRKKNFVAARDLAEKVLTVQPTHVPTAILAGAAEYAGAEYPLAERHLKWVLDLYPDNLYVRKLLVATYGKSGKILSAIDTLQPALKQAPQDPDLLALAGEVYMQANQYAKATQYLDMAVKIKPEDVGKRLAAGTSRLASGESEQAVTYLESVVAAAPAQPQARILLAMAHLRRGEFDKALDLVTRLEQEMPRNPLILNLRGSVYVGKKDYADARRTFENALALQASFFPAAANLAQLDLRDKNVAAARKRFDTVLEHDKNNTQAMLAIAELLAREPGKMEESVRWIERARLTQPGDPRIAVTMARAQIALGDRTQALDMAHQAAILGDGDVQILEDAAQLQLAAGGTRDAFETYQKIARLMPTSAEAQYRLASAQYLTGNSAVAKQMLRKALDLKPDLQEAMVLLAKLEASGGNRDSALELVERVKKLPPDASSGLVLEGDVEMLSKKYANAAQAYERAYAIRKSGNLAAQIHQAYLRAGKPSQGETVVLEWLRVNPADVTTRQYLADASMQVSRLAVAIAQYEWLVQNQPANQQALNNLAWAYNENADARAVATAEKAYKLNENNPAVADTYGWILYRNAQVPKAVETLKHAVALAPNSRDTRYHYAQALAKAGDRKNARLELERVLVGATPFEGQTEAKALLDQLKI